MEVPHGPWSRLLAASWTTPTSRWACGKAGLKPFVSQPSTTKPERPSVRSKDSKPKGYAFSEILNTGWQKMSQRSLARIKKKIY